MAVSSPWRPGEPIWSGTINREPMVVQLRPAAGGYRLSWRGAEVSAQVTSPRVAELVALMPEKRAADTSKSLRCPMPGLVSAILVEPGQSVRGGTPLAIVEAMKMENVLRAEREVTVKRIVAKPGEILAVDAVIMEFE